MTLSDFAQWVLAAVAVDIYDGRPDGTPAGNYAYLTTEAGITSRTDVTKSDRATPTVHIVCVGIDPAGARWVADQVRGQLTDARPDGNHPLVSLPAGPELTDGTPTTGGERTSITLTYQLITRR